MLQFLLQLFSIMRFARDYCCRLCFPKSLLLLIVSDWQLLSSLPWGSSTLLRRVVAATWLAVKSCRPDQHTPVLPGHMGDTRYRRHRLHLRPKRISAYASRGSAPTWLPDKSCRPREARTPDQIPIGGVRNAMSQRRSLTSTRRVRLRCTCVVLKVEPVPGAFSITSRFQNVFGY